MAPEFVGPAFRSAAERCDYAVRCFMILSVAGDLLTDMGTRPQQAGDMTSDALAELVELSQQVACAVAGLDKWETARASATSRQPVGDNQSRREQPYVVGVATPPTVSIAEPPPAQNRPARDSNEATAHRGGEDPDPRETQPQRGAASPQTTDTCHGNRNPNRELNGSVGHTQYVCGRHSRGGTWLSIEVRAFCECGWTTRWQHWAVPPGAASAAVSETSAALAEHQVSTGHHLYRGAGVPEPDGYHQACGWFHAFQDCCPAPPTSPTGRLSRTCAALSLQGKAAALDQIAAIVELRDWLDEQHTHGIIRARIAGCAWTDIAAAGATDAGDVQRRWGPMIRRYEAAGLLKPPPPQEPENPS